MRHVQRKSRRPSRSAFTLVEMLVSVTLVLLMMTLFASIFQMATGSMAKQRGIAENDQRARTLATIIRKDLQHRTSRYMLPYYPTEDSATSPTSFSNRAGYFYISTNDPYSGLDDLIQFTVSANILSEDPDSTPFFGKAATLTDRSVAVSSTNPNLSVSPNQPETDDGSVSGNGTGSSPAAEICYFVRGGNLYRRVILIREPIAFAGQDLAPQPTSRNGYDYFYGQPQVSTNSSYDGLFQTTTELTNDFYRIFDYSAFAFRDARNGAGSFQSASFLGTASLINNSVGAAGEYFANPARRFGFNPILGTGSSGQSREHTVLPGVGVPKFIGRPTQAETSSFNFNWPQGLSSEETGSVSDSSNVLTGTNGNPFDIVGCPLSLNVGNSLISEFDSATSGEGRGGARRMEDLLLANVHEMNVEIWDDRLQRFVSPGHTSKNPITGEAGDYHKDRNGNLTYGPLGSLSFGRVFDTWHRKVDLNDDGTAEPPPYVAYRFYPPVQPMPPAPGSPAGPSPATMTALGGPFATYWQPGSFASYSVGSVIFAPWVDDNGIPGPPFVPDGIFDYSEMPEPKFQIAYRCVAVNNLNGVNGIETSTVAPVFPTAPGKRVTDNEVTWESFDNRRPLRAVRLQIRYIDKTSDQMRQISIMMPMSENL